MIAPRTLAVLALAALAPSAALAQGAVDPALMAAGQAVFDRNCAICHKSNGLAPVPAIPNLSESENLEDPAFVTSAIVSGIANMPPFHTLSDEDVAAVATYVRNSWGHAYGGVTADEVKAERAALDPPPPLVSIWDGVYTVEQAEQGAKVYKAPCGLCHGTKLNGAPDDMDMVPGPALARAAFLRNWNGRSLGALYSMSRLTMPKSNPGFLPDEDYAAIVAHMLATSNVPPGSTPLPADPIALGAIIISEPPQ